MLVGLLGLYSGTPEIHCDIWYFTAKHLDPTCMWNIINSTCSIRTYINTAISVFSTCLLIYHMFIFIRSLWSLSILISSWAYLPVTRVVGITLAGLIMYLAISFPVAAFISTKNSFKLCPSFNFKALERELLYEIWPYRPSFIICLGA